MRNLIALAVIAFGAYIVYTGNAEGLTPLDAIKALVGIGGGLVYLAVANFNDAKNFISNAMSPKVIEKPKVEDRPKQPIVVKPQDSGQYPPNNFELYDHLSLIHIRNRLIKAHNVEGVDLCVKIATIMFTLDVFDAISKEVEDSTVADALSPENAKAPDVKTKVSV
jgi:hypothetical protein